MLLAGKYLYYNYIFFIIQFLLHRGNIHLFLYFHGSRHLIMQKTPFNSTISTRLNVCGQEKQIPGQHQDKIIGTRGTLLTSIMKQLPIFLVAARGNNRFSDSVKTASTD